MVRQLCLRTVIELLCMLVSHQNLVIMGHSTVKERYRPKETLLICIPLNFAPQSVAQPL